MKRKLVVTAEYHGEFIHTNRKPHEGKDIGTVEWPPSVFRLGCSVTCGAAKRHEDGPAAEAAVRKFMPLPLPVIHAAPLRPGHTDVTRWVPHNHGDLMVKRGRPLGDDKVARHEARAAFGISKVVSYIYDIDEGFTDDDVRALRSAAISNNILGTGQDICTFDVFTSDAEPEREDGVLRWTPRPGGRENPLRVPNAETYDDLQRCHESRSRCHMGPKGTYTERIIPSRFNIVSYPPETSVPSRPFKVFRILGPETGGEQNPGQPKKFLPRNTTGVSAMTRHAANKLSELSWNIPGADRLVAVLGHAPDGGKVMKPGMKTKRLSYIPIPGIYDGDIVGGVGHVIVAEGWNGDGVLARWAAGMDGSPLIEQNGDLFREVARLKLIEEPSHLFPHLIGASRTWQSVTPVLLDPIKDGETFKDAVARTILNSDIPSRCVEVHTRDISEDDRIPVANHLKDRKQVHMTIRFEHPISGPLCIGGARHYGIGLFVSVSENP